jgi:23S rRNA (guanine2445-N2)-methyltransferase / 23S rRNA (guanine2069-N7)-methyltransferase
MARPLTFVATASRGTEHLLVRELRRAGVQRVHEERGAVRFHGRLRDGYTACMRTRLASRVLLMLDRFEAKDADTLYAGVHAIAWEDHLPQHATFAVRFHGVSRTLRDTRFSTLRTKDAIVDRLRARVGNRPDVDPKDPDLRIHVHLRDASASVYLDLAGDPLHERGGQREPGQAPMRETLAAALLHLADWPTRARLGEGLIDPMCGGGTLIAEAAAIAADRDPGLLRERWGFDAWLGHDAEAWAQVRDAAWQRAGSAGPHGPIFGTDIDGDAVHRGRRLLDRLGLQPHATISRGDFVDATPPEGVTGLVVVNPPYGRRLGAGDDLLALYAQLGQTLKRFVGWEGWIITEDVRFLRQLHLKPAQRHTLYNGALECPVGSYPIRGADLTADR